MPKMIKNTPSEESVFDFTSESSWETTSLSVVEGTSSENENNVKRTRDTVHSTSIQELEERFLKLKESPVMEKSVTGMKSEEKEKKHILVSADGSQQEVLAKDLTNFFASKMAEDQNEEENTCTCVCCACKVLIDLFFACIT